MAENSGTDPAVDTNAEENAATSGTIIMVTVKTPKDKEEIAISEDASVAQVCWSSPEMVSGFFGCPAVNGRFRRDAS